MGLFLGLLLGREEARARPLGSLQAPPRGDPTPYGWGWKAPPIWGGTGTGEGFSSQVVMAFFLVKRALFRVFWTVWRLLSFPGPAEGPPAVWSAAICLGDEAPPSLDRYRYRYVSKKDLLCRKRRENIFFCGILDCLEAPLLPRARPLGSLQAPPGGDPTPYDWGWKASPIWGGTGTGKGFSRQVVMAFFW